MEPFESVPPWLIRPLPANATTDPKLHDRITTLGRGLSDDPTKCLAALDRALTAVSSFQEYDAAANWATGYVWQVIDRLLDHTSPPVRVALFQFATRHMPLPAQHVICRRLAIDRSVRIRNRVRRFVAGARLREVALPATGDGDWDPTGWFRPARERPLQNAPHGPAVQARHGLPELRTVGALRELLDVRSPNQLGYFLLASDANDGPYTRFTIPKRDGGERAIAAPKAQLRWVQRRLLDLILAKMPAHHAAHGFVAGRSTVTNAAPHTGSKLILKFDLSDFFPTIHYYRVVGLFTRLGYPVGNAKFQVDDQAPEVSPTLARLCCYTPDPRSWGTALLPQGAPTSPAISNLVCRRLDARLDGLARRNAAVYTRYADDLTFSFKEDFADIGRFRWWVDQICHQEGFLVNQAKFRAIRSSQRQLVTGIVVNDTVRIPREERRQFRALLHNCRRHGVESQARGRPGFAGYVRGFASYINMVHPEEGAAYLAAVGELFGTESGTASGEDGP